MTNSERASYIQGLMEGLQLDPEAKETKVFQAMVELLDDLCSTVEELENGFSTIAEEVEEIDENLGDIEEIVYGGCSCGHDHDEDLQFEVQCPSCKEVIEINDEMLSNDTLTCPKCNGTLEFVFGEDDEDSCDCDSCAHEHDKK